MSIIAHALFHLFLLISDPRRGCFIVLSMFIFFSFFSATILSGPYLWNRYSQRLQIQCAAWSCGLVVHYCLPSNSLSFFLYFFLFFAKILSGSYLWNCYSQGLQIECDAWFYGLVLHYCLPSNSFRYFFYFFNFFFFFCHDFARTISLEPLLAEIPNRVCCLVLRSNFALLLTIQFTSLLDQSSGDRSSVAYRATENLSRSLYIFIYICFCNSLITS